MKYMLLDCLSRRSLSCRKSISLTIVAAAMLASSLAFAQTSQVPEELPLSGSAYVIAGEAYEAFGRGDYGVAISKAREAIRQRPDVARLRVLLVLSLEAAGQIENAKTTAEQFIAAGDTTAELSGHLARIEGHLSEKAVSPANETPAQQPVVNAAADAANKAYQSFNQKNWKDAIIRAREAMRLAPDNRDYRLLLVNSLIAAGETFVAEKEISSILLQFGPDRSLLQQRGYLRQKAGSPVAAANDFENALKMAGSAKDKRLLRLSLADARIAAKQPQRALDALAPFSDEKSYDVTSRRGFALSALGQKKEALEAFTLAAQDAPTPSQRDVIIASKIGTLADLDEMGEARAVLGEALTEGQLGTLSSFERPYLALRSEDFTTADMLFKAEQEQGRLKGKALIDAAYTAKKVFDNKRAGNLMRLSIDAYEAGQISLEPQYVFGLRREVADMTRNWGAYASVVYGSVGVMPGATFVPISGGNVTQSIKEIYWRPPVIGYRNGALFELFVRSFTTLDDDTGGPVGVSTMQGSVGARWKPFSNYNVVLEASRLFPIGKDSREDTLLRIAFSESRGTDLRVDVPSWWMGQIYAEAGRYLEEKQNIANIEARAGHSIRIDGISNRLVLSPFVAVNANFDSLLETKWAVGVGPGVNVRYWFREDKYTAPMSYIDLNVQYRFKIEGDKRAEGLSAGLLFAY